MLLNVDRLPRRESDPYDAAYANAAALQRAGVRFAIVTDDASQSRNLPYEAAMAARLRPARGRGAARDHALARRDLRRGRPHGLDRGRARTANLVAGHRRHHGPPHAGDARLHRRRAAVARDAPHAALRAVQGPAVKRPLAVGAAALLLLGAAAPRASGQHYQSDFPPEEFKARWDSRLRRDRRRGRRRRPGRAAHERLPAAAPDNSFYYLSGIETPHAYLRLDGRTPEGHALPAAAQRAARARRRQGALGRRRRAREATDGRRRGALDRGDGRSAGRSASGRAGRDLRRVRPGRGLRREPLRAPGARRRDRRRLLGRPRLARAAASSSCCAPATRAPRSATSRPSSTSCAAIKSPREIALDSPRVAARRPRRDGGHAQHRSRASTSTSSTPLRATSSSLNGARLDGYRSITASGTDNINNMHYFRNTQQARGRRPGADGLRARLPLLRERHRADVAGQRHVPALAARAAAVRARVPQRRDDAHPARRHADSRSATRRSRRWTPVFARTKFSKPVYEAGGAQAGRDGRRRASRTPSAWRCTTSAATARPAEARPGLLGRPAAVGAGGEPLLPLRGHRRRDRDRLSRTSRTSCRCELDALEALAREKGIVQTLPALGEAGFERLRRPASR